MTSPTVASRVARGSILSLVGQGLSLIASLAATPVLIRLLGPEQYGLLTIFNTVGVYCGFAELGMGVTSTRIAADQLRDNGARGEASTIATAGALVTLSSGLMLAVTCLGSSTLAIALHLRGSTANDAVFGFRVIAVTSVLRALGSVMNTSILIRLRMGLYALLVNGVSILQIVALPIVVSLGYGIRGAVIVMCLCAALVLSLHTFFAFRLQPALWKSKPQRSIVPLLARFGGHVLAYNVTFAILAQGEKLILPARASIEVLAHYAVASNLAALVVNVPYALGQSLIPAFSTLQAPEQVQARADLYAQTQRITALWLPAVLLALVAVGRPIIAAWAGASYVAESYPAFVVLLVGLALYIPGYNANFLLMASGRSATLARLNLIELPIFLTLAIVLSPRLGAVGAAIAWTVRVILDALFQLALARKLAGNSSQPVLTAGERNTLAVAMLPLGGGALVLLVRGAPLPIVAASVCAGLLVLVVAMWRRVMRPTERASVELFFARLLRFSRSSS